MKILINEDNNDLYCTFSKEPIYVGEKYIEIVEYYMGEPIVKTYKLENAPIDPSEEEPYIQSEE